MIVVCERCTDESLKSIFEDMDKTIQRCKGGKVGTKECEYWHTTDSRKGLA